MMRLQWGVLDIQSPDAQLGDTKTDESNAIVRENRGLQPITYRDPQWPTNVRNKYSVKTMTRAEHDAVIDFLVQSAGDRITLTDHNGYVWTGVVTTPIPEIVTIQDGCSYDIEFEFLGSN
jgi:hypothetical protein